jgi:hypothetical protein
MAVNLDMRNPRCFVFDGRDHYLMINTVKIFTDRAVHNNDLIS